MNVMENANEAYLMVNDANILFRNLTSEEIDKVKKIASANPEKYTFNLIEPIKQVLSEREDVKYFLEDELQKKGPANDQEMFNKIYYESRDSAIFRSIFKEEKKTNVVNFEPAKQRVKASKPTRSSRLDKAGFSDVLMLCLGAQMAILCLLIGILSVLK